jgi:four helix bundle protein
VKKLRREEIEKPRKGVEKMERKRNLRHFRDLEVYQRAFKAAMQIFQLTKTFPPEEKYALVDQIRRASRSVCSNLAEEWRKRKYIAVFRNKVSDSLQEASETQCWLEFSLACQYITQRTFHELDDEYEQIIAMLSSMDKNAEKFCY